MPLKVAQQYCRTVINTTPLGNGHINDTYLIETGAKPFVLQKINKHVFPNPEQIMVNLKVLNQHISEIGDVQCSLRLPSLILTESGHVFCQDQEGDYWRALSFIDNTESLEIIRNLAEAGQVGFALGQFHRLTRMLDVNKLHDTLPGFHICPSYLAHYYQVLKVSDVQSDPFCTGFINSYHHIANDLETGKTQGLLSTRVIHGDPKLNNFLFDINSQHIVSIIDLDTVKPGLIHYDIGDCIRSCCHSTETNEFNLEICRVLLTSYLKEMGEFLTEYDYEFLYSAIRLIPFELGLRFYTDYLERNRYFKVTEFDQNLHRATEQFRLCADVMTKEAEIKSLIV